MGGVIILAVAFAAEITAAPLIDGTGLLGLLGVLVLAFGTIVVFRTGSNSRIDAKRETEITRLDNELGDVRADVAFLRGDVGTLARVATRAIRTIQDGGAEFQLSAEEWEVLERTRPLGIPKKTDKEGTPS